MMKLRRAFVLSLFFLPQSPAVAVTAATQVKLDQLAEPLTEDKVFYRWQSTESGKNLVQLGTMNEATNRYFMKMRSGIEAGAGIYMAGGVSSSSSYLPSVGGNIIEIHIPKGTPFLDMTDRATLNKMQRMGLRRKEVTESKKYARGIIIKYEEDWFVGKNLVAVARFEMFPGKNQTPKSVLSHYHALRADAASTEPVVQMEKQIMNNRSMVETIVKAPDISDEFTRKLMSGEQLKRAIGKDVVKIDDASSALKVMKAFDNVPEVEELINADLTLQKELETKLLRYSSPRDFGEFAAKRSPEWATLYTQTYGAHATTTRRMLYEFVQAANHVYEYSSERFLKQIEPVANFISKDVGSASQFDKVVARVIDQRLAQARVAATEIEPLVYLIHNPLVAETDRAALLAQFTATKRIQVAYREVLATQSGKSIEKLFAEVRTMDELQVVTENLRRDMGARVFSQQAKLKRNLAEVLSKDRSLLLRHFNTAPNAVTGFGKITNAMQELGVDISPANRSWLKGVSPELRGDFLSSCMSHFICFARIKNSLPEIAADMDDLALISKGMVKRYQGALDSWEVTELKKLEEQLLAKMTKPQQLTSYGSFNSKQLASSKFLAKAEQIGLDKFRPSQLHFLLTDRTLNASAKRILLTRSVANAVNAEDIAAIRQAMDATGLNKSDLASVVARRMHELKPGANFDCVSGWTTILDKF